jgi:hypothetical protein
MKPHTNQPTTVYFKRLEYERWRIKLEYGLLDMLIKTMPQLDTEITVHLQTARDEIERAIQRANELIEDREIGRIAYGWENHKRIKRAIRKG